MNIEEASIKGNAQVLETIFSELGHDLSSSTFTDTVKLVFGDQHSVGRIRGVTSNRVGHDSLAKSLVHATFAPGFFHYQMTATFSVLETHWGNPSLGHHNPASLSWHNTLLDRKPFVLSSRPPYHVARDLIFHSLYGRVLHCLELVASCVSLDDYAENITFEELQGHIKKIVAEYVFTTAISELRSARQKENVNAKIDTGDALPTAEGDMVFENVCLFLRDALVLRELADAIKAGDSGRIIIILKVLALSYRGSGHTKYAQECLIVIHSLVHLWPKPLRAIILKNWLVNTSGKEGHWYPVDLLQEHNIFWTKTIYNTQGSGASWEWLEMILPCITILRQLVTSMNEALGSRQGSKHAPPDLRRDLQEIQRTLAEAHVYSIIPGRRLEGDKAVVPNVITIGLQRLAGPLAEYNRTFARQQVRRRRTQPLVGANTNVQLEAASSSSIATTPTVEEHIELHEGSDEEAGDEGDVDHSASMDVGAPLFSLDEEEDVALYMD
ncbi:hypothetical protein C8Q72DRAFT_823117 [Fomitopsis betulina]|nr:hypothetical protein C8Q72DRAFT_823117 [Fomitopsis betulina]